MYFAQSEIDHIRSTRSVLEFLEHPRRSGKCMKAVCPLPGHDDRTPSFFVYPDGGYWCFGCGRGGKDVISFAFHYWGLAYPRDFPLALERLGARSDRSTDGRPLLPPAPKVPVARREVWPQLPDAATLAVYRVAAAAWQQALWRPTGADALAYLHRRGLSDEVIRREGIGFATDILPGELRRHGLDPAVAQAAGLLRHDSREFFAGRVVLWEWRRLGGVRTPVWATARLCTAGPAWDDTSKYLNVRGDRLLGGLEGALGRPEVAVVEGSFDRLAVQVCGDPAVFLGSSAPSDAVLSELRHLAKRAVLYLVRDRDRAGRRGAWHTLYRLDLPPAARIVLVDLPPGVKDPGELAMRPDGAALYRAARRQGRPIDLERLKRRCERCHALVAQRHAAARGAGHSARPTVSGKTRDGTDNENEKESA